MPRQQPQRPLKALALAEPGEGTRKADAPAKAAPPPPEKLGVAVLSLIGFVLFGVGLSGYCLYYTDYFPIVGGLLGLGGLFSCLALLSSLMSDARKEQLQEAFDRLVLQRHSSWIVLAVLAWAFVGWAAGRGTLLIASPGDDLDRVVTIQADGVEGEPLADDEPLAAHGSLKVLAPTAWWGSRAYRVKVSGLPAAIVQVSAFQRTPIVVPGSFIRRPVVLVRPSAGLSGTAHRTDKDDPLRLEVRVDDRVVGTLEPYRGEAVWVGAGADVTVPVHVRDRWRLELVKDSIPEAALSHWLPPRAVGEWTMLRAGQTLRVELFHHGEKTGFACRDVVVSPVGAAIDFPEEVHLDGPC